MNRSFRGSTEVEARAAAAAELAIDIDDVHVRELVRRSVGEGDEAREEVEIVVRVPDATPDVDESELLQGFTQRKQSPDSAPAVEPPVAAVAAVAAPEAASEASPEARDSQPRTPRPERSSRGPRRPAPSAEDAAGAASASPEALAPRARDFLAGMIERMQVSASFELEIDDDNVYIEIIADDGLGGLLIGRKGQTLDALQYLTNRVVLPGAQARGRIYLDTENYREKHLLKMEKRALELRDEALRDARSITLEDLNPRDRWIIHQALADDARVTTKSVGESDDRRLMIIPS